MALIRKGIKLPKFKPAKQQSPLTKAKMRNGIPGYRDGGQCDKAPATKAKKK